MKLINYFRSLWNKYFGKKEKLFCAEVKQVVKPIPVKVKTPEEIAEAELIASRNNLNPERFEGESFEEYRRRRKVAKVYAIKRQQLVHSSKTAIKDKTGIVKGFTKGITFTGDTSNLKSK